MGDRQHADASLRHNVGAARCAYKHLEKAIRESRRLSVSRGPWRVTSLLPEKTRA
jgi:hypothetical protein